MHLKSTVRPLSQKPQAAIVFSMSLIIFPSDFADLDAGSFFVSPSMIMRISPQL